jgi:hypothetical protein
MCRRAAGRRDAAIKKTEATSSMQIKNQKDFWAGVMFVGFVFFAAFGTQYIFGSDAHMGPGYFPTVLGLILVVLGIVIPVGTCRPRRVLKK